MPNWNSSVIPVTTPDGEVHQEEPAPVPRHLEERLVPGPRVARLHVGHHDGEPEGEGDEEEVEEGDGGELDPGEYCDAHAPTSLSWPDCPFNNRAAVRVDSPGDDGAVSGWLRHQASSVRETARRRRRPRGGCRASCSSLQTGLLARIVDGVIFRHSAARLPPAALRRRAGRHPPARGRHRGIRAKHGDARCAAKVKQAAARAMRRSHIERHRAPRACRHAVPGRSRTSPSTRWKRWTPTSRSTCPSGRSPPSSPSRSSPWSSRWTGSPGSCSCSPRSSCPLSMIVIGDQAHERNQRLWARLAADERHGSWTSCRGFPPCGCSTPRDGRRRQIERASDEHRVLTMSVLRIAFLSSFMLELISAVSIAIVAVISGLPSSPRDHGLQPRVLHPAHRPGVLPHAAHARDPVPLPHGGGERRGADRSFPGAAAASRGRRGSGTARTSHEPARNRAAGRGLLLWRRAGPFGPVSLAITPGQHVAITGPSGAGKSTLLALLNRFAHPQNGEITIDGVPLAVLDPAEWRRAVAWLPQRPTLFHGTVGDNVRLGQPDASNG